MIKRSISARLALLFAFASTAIVLTFGILLRDSLHESLRKQMHNELLFRESLMKPWIASRTTLDGWRGLTAKFNDLASAEGGRVQYWILSESPALNVGGPPPNGIAWSSIKSGFNQVAGLTEGACPLFLLMSEVPAQGERPVVQYVVAIDSTPYMGTLSEFTRMLTLITVIGVVLVALLGFAIARIGMRPVNRLSAQANLLAPGERKRRLETATLPNELKNLAEAFNGVLERQEIAWQQLESFNADVAHELKTPLTNLIGQAQLALSRPREAHDLADLLGSNLEELERMTAIVNDMLFLSHAQAGEHATQLTEVSLREEAYKTAEYLEPLLLENRLSLQVEGDAMAHIDRRLFHRSLANLLSNSARHAPPDSTITVTLTCENGRASVTVANLGEPIAPEHIHRLFERFYRVDASRTDSGTHHGLGLSIVKAVALMHRGDVFVSSQNGVNAFGLTFATGALES